MAKHKKHKAGASAPAVDPAKIPPERKPGDPIDERMPMTPEHPLDERRGGLDERMGRDD